MRVAEGIRLATRVPKRKIHSLSLEGEELETNLFRVFQSSPGSPHGRAANPQIVRPSRIADSRQQECPGAVHRLPPNPVRDPHIVQIGAGRAHRTIRTAVPTSDLHPSSGPDPGVTAKSRSTPGQLAKYCHWKQWHLDPETRDLYWSSSVMGFARIDSMKRVTSSIGRRGTSSASRTTGAIRTPTP
jgi:hypothetical protein